MSVIKSFSVGHGDMFYIDHISENFTIIDCSLEDDYMGQILDEIEVLIRQKNGITRFISTHPDEDHLRGLQFLDDRLELLNFYCVQNDAAKSQETDSFLRYRKLHDSEKAFFISKDCRRRWMNETNEERHSSGINVLWPDLSNPYFIDALAAAANEESPNNISAIFKYELSGGAVALWMGDLETDFLRAIEDEVIWPKVGILFAPHHGRDSGKVPKSILERLSPGVIVIGEAPSQHLNYYSGYNTITQNTAGDILFDCDGDRIHVFTKYRYTVDFLSNEYKSRPGYYYAGSLTTGVLLSRPYVS